MSSPLHVRRHRRAPFSAFRRPRLEWLEERLTPATVAQSVFTFDPASGVLAVSARSAQIEFASNVEVIIEGLTYTVGRADASNLKEIDAAGSINFVGNISVAGRLAINAASVTVTGELSAGTLAVASQGLLDVENGATLSASLIQATANYFVNTGQIQSKSISVSSSYFLNAGAIDAPGGSIHIGVATSYIDTATSITSASAVGGHGGQVVIDGGAAGRVFSSGTMSAAGAAGGTIQIHGQDILLIADSIDAMGTGGKGGHVQVLSERSTDFSGRIITSGVGSNASGTIEVSSHGQLTYQGAADAGKGGSLLLDPQYLIISAAPTGVFPQYSLANPSGDSSFGTQVTSLSNGNVIVMDWYANNYMGAVYLFNGTTGALLSAVTGSTGGSLQTGDEVGQSIVPLTNNNFVVGSPYWNGGMGSGGMGAATWIDGMVGLSGVISASNSLVGSLSGDAVGSSLTPLVNGNYVVGSPSWNGARGAATWGDGTVGVKGPVSASNSLVGTNGFTPANNDTVGQYITALANGCYVVASPKWNFGDGAVTWGNGSAGITGPVSSANSLVGSVVSDAVGLGGVTALPNGNYVIVSSQFHNYTGAVTWANGSSGISGFITTSNSLVGSAGDQIGAGGVTVLANFNYVISSPFWNNEAGAVTWENGVNPLSGSVSASNSLVAVTGTASELGSRGITALANGNYVVASPSWTQVIGGTAYVSGAVTWGNGTSGTSGVVSAANSLIGSARADNVGTAVVGLTNGNYVAISSKWNNDEGAVTLGNGATGTTGIVSAANSQVGSTPASSGVNLGDQIASGGVVPLTNGNYVVASPFWSDRKGAVTWGNGTYATVGVVSATNSLVGSNTSPDGGKSPGDDFGKNVVALTNGNYIAGSYLWNVGSGAVSWGNGKNGSTGVVAASNSLVGSHANDQVGFFLTALTNGNYVVGSPSWNGLIGAESWGNGTTGTIGTVSGLNSLIGGTSPDQVGATNNGGNGIVALADGNYVVNSGLWMKESGAATWVNGTTGLTIDGQNSIDAQNSLISSHAGDTLNIVQPGHAPGSFIAVFNDMTGQVLIGLTNPNQLTYSLADGQTITITPAFLTQALNLGTNVILQADDDITVNSPIVTTPNASAGSLTLAAGRSIFLNANVNTAGGNLKLVANDIQADGVIDSQRDPGPAAITMVSGVTLNTGSGSFLADIKNSSDKTNNTSGTATLLGITAASASLSSATALGISLNGQIPGDGVFAGSYTQVNVTGSLNLNRAGLQLTHTTAATGSSSFTIVHSTGGIIGTFAGIPDGSVINAPDGTSFKISYRANGGDDVVLTQIVNPTQLLVLTQPLGNTAPGKPFGLTVAATDSLGDVATSFAGNVTLALASNPGSGTLSGTLSVKAVNGVATFSGLSLNNLGFGYTIQATGGGFQPATTNPFNISVFSSFTLSNTSVLAFRPPGTVVGTLNATEPGTGHTFTYALVSGTGSAGNGSFSIAGNQLLTNDAFDFSVQPSYTIRVRATDETNQYDEQTFTITIKSDPNVTRAGTILTITGTSGNDVFSVVPTSDRFNMTLNSVNLAADVAAIKSVVFQAGAGNDTAYIYGSSTGTNTLALNPTGGSLTGSGYAVSLVSVETVQAFGKAGDVAYLYDAAGKNTFVATPAYGFFSGAKFYDQEVGFSTANAYAATSTNDTAYLYDGGGNNVFVGTPTHSYMQGTGYFNQVIGFTAVNAFATAGSSNDAAYLFDNGGTNTFVGSAGSSNLKGSGYFNQAVGFKSVFATAAAGANDSAYFFGASSGNVFTANTAYSYMYGPGYLNEAVGFKTVSATGSATDTASLYDGSGSNTYSAQGAGGSLAAASIIEAETGFGYVNIIQSQGSFDTALANGITFSLNKVGTWH